MDIVIVGIAPAGTLPARRGWTPRVGLFRAGGCDGARLRASSRPLDVALWRWRRAAARTLWAGCLRIRDARSV